MKGPESVRPQASNFRNMKLTPPVAASDRKFPDISSRKRKAEFLDQHCSNTVNFDGVSEPFKGNHRDDSVYLLPRVSNSQHNAGVFSGRNVHGDALRMMPNQNSQVTESCNELSQFGQHHFYDRNNYSMTMQNKDGNFQRAAVEKMHNACASVQHLLVHNNESSCSLSFKSPISEMSILPVVQHQKYVMAIPNDRNKLELYSGVHNVSMEKDHTVDNFKGGLIFEQRNHTDDLLHKPLSSPSDILAASEVSQHSITKNQKLGHYGNEDGTAYVHDSTKNGSAFEFKQNGAGTVNVSSYGLCCSQTSACDDGKETCASYKYPQAEVNSSALSWNRISGFNVNGKTENQLGSVTCQMSMLENSSIHEETCVEGGKVNVEAKNSTDNMTNVIEKPDGSDVEKMDPSVKKKLPNDVNNSTMISLEHGGDPSSWSPNLGGKGAPHAGKVPPKMSEKLWDGSLQLNASITVSAVAFFKSGEKALEVDWSKLIEVKGKVRLEAFEKYIQELPRSRNRALMVISLCWKDGSSKKGLVGMKEVARGYREGDKVGFAQPAPGIDLYVCPRSNTIITILAKHGFFKGMAAVEDNHDSLIGCVVWRKNRTSLNSAPKKSEKKKLFISEQQLDSPSDSMALPGGEISSPLVTAPDENQSMPPMSQPAKVSTTICDTRSKASESENMSTKAKDAEVNDSSKFDNPFANVIPIRTPSNIDKSPVSSMGPPSCKPDSNCLSETSGGSQKAEIRNSNINEPSKLDTGLELLEPVLGGPGSSDDDDLPEFDFGTACGLPQHPDSKPALTSKESHFSDPRLQKQIVEGISDAGRSLPTIPPTAIQMGASTDQRRLQALMFRGPAIASHQGIPPPRKPGIHDSVFGEESANLSSDMLTGPPTVQFANKLAATLATDSHMRHKNIWDDDDDMPEWCPPDLDQGTQPQATETIGPSNLTPVLKPAFKRPLLPSNAMFGHPPSYPQAFPNGSHREWLGERPPTNAVMLQQTRSIAGFPQFRPSHPPGFNPSGSLRPQPPLFKLNSKTVNRRARKH